MSSHQPCTSLGFNLYLTAVHLITCNRLMLAEGKFCGYKMLIFFLKTLLYHGKDRRCQTWPEDP